MTPVSRPYRLLAWLLHSVPRAGAPGWVSFSPASAVRSLGFRRQAVIQALEHLHEVGLIDRFQRHPTHWVVQLTPPRAFFD